MKKLNGKRLFEIAIMFFWASEYCHTPYFTPYLDSLGITPTLAGIIVGCYGFTQLVVRIPLGMATDATSAYKNVVIGGLFFTTLSSFGLWLFTDVRLIFFFRVLAGVAASTWIAMTVAYMSYYSDADNVNATAQLNGLNNAGKLMAFILGAAAAQIIGYRATLFMSFLTGLIGLVLVPFMGKVEIERKPATVAGLVKCLKNKQTVIPALVMSLAMMIIHGTVYSFTSNLAINVGASPMMLSVLSVVYTVVQIAIVGFIKSDFIKNGRRDTEIALSFVLMSIYLVTLALADNVWTILAGQILAAVAYAMLNSLMLSECVKGVSPGEKTTAMGIFQAVYSIGMTIGPVYMGRVIETLGARTGCLIFAGLVLFAALAIQLFLFKPAKVDKAA